MDFRRLREVERGGVLELWERPTAGSGVLELLQRALQAPTPPLVEREVGRREGEGEEEQKNGV